VGGQSASADSLGKQGGSPDIKRNPERDQEAAAPGLFSTIKSMIGLGTDSGDVKQNRGEGRGVTGTGTFSNSKRQLHTSTRAAAPDNTAKSSNNAKPQENPASPPSHPSQDSNTPEEPSGKWNNAGVGDSEYQTVDKENPYEPPTEDSAGPEDKEAQKEARSSYGGVKRDP